MFQGRGWEHNREKKPTKKGIDIPFTECPGRWGWKKRTAQEEWSHENNWLCKKDRN